MTPYVLAFWILVLLVVPNALALVAWTRGWP